MSRTHRAHFPEGGDMDRRYGQPQLDHDAPLIGLQGSNVPVFVGQDLGHVMRSHRQLFEADHAEERRMAGLKAGMGDVGIAMVQAQERASQSPEAGSDTMAA